MFVSFHNGRKNMKPKTKTPKITWTIDKSRTGLVFSGGERARVILTVMPTTPDSVIPDAALLEPEVREASGLNSYSRLLVELSKTAGELAGAEKQAKLALDSYTSSVAQGGDSSVKQAEISTARSRVEQLRQGHDALLASATEARASTVQNLQAFFRDRQMQRRAEAVRRMDEVIQDIAGEIAKHLPELSKAKAAWNRVSTEGVDVDSLVASLPAPVAEETPKNSFQHQNA